VKYLDPDGRTLYVIGSAEYKSKVQKALRQLYPEVYVNFDTGEVTIRNNKKETYKYGYEIISTLIGSSKTNIIWLGASKKLGNGTTNYTGDTITLINTNYIRDETGGAENSIIDFNPDDWLGGKDDDGFNYRPPYVGLAHEAGHSEAMNNGTQTYEGYHKELGTTPECEENSMKRENEIRSEHDLTSRTNYWQ